MLTRVRELIAAQLNIPVDSIKVESRLIEDLKADSLDIVELIMALEEFFNVEIPDEDLSGIKTVGDVVSYIESK